MPLSHAPNSPQRGFTLLEILFVVAVMGVLIAVAVPMYQGYLARSRASELVLKFDAIRTRMQVLAKSDGVQISCAALADSVQPANLHSDYAHLAVDFEPISGGFAPVLTMCATSATQGVQGVAVTRQAHSLLSRDNVVNPGAVLGDSVASFSVKLAGGTPLCKTLPASSAKPACTSGVPPNTQTPAVTGTGNPATVPAVAASQPAVLPTPVASQPVSVASAVSAAGNGQVGQQLPFGAQTCPAVVPGPVNRQVMYFGSAADGYVASTGNLQTNGNLHAFSAEVVLAADHMQASNAPGATLLSYAPATSSGAGFSLWNPQSLHITLAGTEYDTGLNVDNGQAHRLTISWQSDSGTLMLYDNGQRLWRQQGANTNGTLGGNGRLVIGQDQRVRPGGLVTYRDGYQGSILSAALASQAISATQAVSGPLHNVFRANSGLLTDVAIGPNGKPIDSTGHATYKTGGAISVQGVSVSTSVYVDSNCK